MQRAIALVLILAACNRGPQVDLPVCSGGVELEIGLKHSMVIDAGGNVTIDGVTCANEEEAEEALLRMVKSMHNNDAIAAEQGRLFAPDEPLIVRIDQATRFSDAEHWLQEARGAYGIYRTRIVVRDLASGNQRCIAIDTESGPPAGVDGALIPCDPATDKARGRVEIGFKSSDFPWWNKGSRTPACFVRQHAVPCEFSTFEMSSWNELRDRLLQIPPSERDFAIDASLPNNTPWRDVVAIVSEALELLHAEIEFY